MKTTQAIDLSPFCDTKPSCYSLDKPWREGRYVYATDGMCLIRVAQKLAPDATAPAGRVPNCEDTLAPIARVRKWEPCPALIVCDTCKNDDGEVRKACDCYGGVCVCVCGYEHECANCDGLGTMFVGWCEKCCVIFAGRLIQRKYIRALSRLPCIKLGATGIESDGPVYFRFTGGVGVVMPVVPSE